MRTDKTLDEAMREFELSLERQNRLMKEDMAEYESRRQHAKASMIEFFREKNHD